MDSFQSYLVIRIQSQIHLLFENFHFFNQICQALIIVFNKRVGVTNYNVTIFTNCCTCSYHPFLCPCVPVLCQHADLLWSDVVNVHPPLINPCVVHLSVMMMDSSTAATKVSQWRPVFVIFTALLFDLLGFTVILPLMPSLLEYYGKTDEVIHL